MQIQNQQGVGVEGLWVGASGALRPTLDDKGRGWKKIKQGLAEFSCKRLG